MLCEDPALRAIQELWAYDEQAGVDFADSATIASVGAHAHDVAPWGAQYFVHGDERRLQHEEGIQPEYADPQHPYSDPYLGFAPPGVFVDHYMSPQIGNVAEWRGCMEHGGPGFGDHRVEPVYSASAFDACADVVGEPAHSTNPFYPCAAVGSSPRSNSQVDIGPCMSSFAWHELSQLSDVRQNTECCGQQQRRQPSVWPNISAAPTPKQASNTLDQLRIPSAGSVGHPFTCADACKYNMRGKGCKDGVECSRCHLCEWFRYARHRPKNR